MQLYGWYLAKDTNPNELFKEYDSTNQPVFTTTQTEAFDFGTKENAEANSFVGVHPVKRPK
jgi:hypothetical protein